MLVKKLREVLAIHRHGSFARAARALGVSQAALSKSVARFEDELKGQIFVRGPNGAELTGFGELVVDQASRVVEEAQIFKQATQLAGGGASSLLRIGFAPALRQHFAPRLLTELVETRPRISLQLEYVDRVRLLPSLLARELDIIFCVRDPSIAASGLNVTPFLSTFGVSVAAPGHPLAGEIGLTAKRVLQYPHAGPRNPNYSARAVYGLGTSELMGPHYEMTDFEPFMPLVLSGRAAAGLAAFSAEPYVTSGQLVLLDLPWTPLEYVMVTTPAAAASPIIKELIDSAQAIGRSMEALQERLRPAAPASS